MDVCVTFRKIHAALKELVKSETVAVGAIGPEKGLPGTRMGAIVPDLPFSP